METVATTICDYKALLKEEAPEFYEEVKLVVSHLPDIREGDRAGFQDKNVKWDPWAAVYHEYSTLANLLGSGSRPEWDAIVSYAQGDATRPQYLAADLASFAAFFPLITILYAQEKGSRLPWELARADVTSSFQISLMMPGKLRLTFSLPEPHKESCAYVSRMLFFQAASIATKELMVSNFGIIKAYIHDIELDVLLAEERVAVATHLLVSAKDAWIILERDLVQLTYLLLRTIVRNKRLSISPELRRAASSYKNFRGSMGVCISILLGEVDPNTDILEFDSQVGLTYRALLSGAYLHAALAVHDFKLAARILKRLRTFAGTAGHNFHPEHTIVLTSFLELDVEVYDFFVCSGSTWTMKRIIKDFKESLKCAHTQQRISPTESLSIMKELLTRAKPSVTLFASKLRYILERASRVERASFKQVATLLLAVRSPSIDHSDYIQLCVDYDVNLVNFAWQHATEMFESGMWKTLADHGIKTPPYEMARQASMVALIGPFMHNVYTIVEKVHLAVMILGDEFVSSLDPFLEELEALIKAGIPEGAGKLMNAITAAPGMSLEEKVILADLLLLSFETAEEPLTPVLEMVGQEMVGQDTTGIATWESLVPRVKIESVMTSRTPSLRMPVSKSKITAEDVAGALGDTNLLALQYFKKAGYSIKSFRTAVAPGASSMPAYLTGNGYPNNLNAISALFELQPSSTGTAHSSLKMVAWLAGEGVSLNDTSPLYHGLKALHTKFYPALKECIIQAVLWIIENGADVNELSGGYTPLSYLIIRSTEPEILTSDQKGTIIAAMLKAGGKINNPEADLTPLVAAVIASDPDMVRWLLAKGAEVEVFSKEGQKALVYAIVNKEEVIVHLLIAAGASTAPYKQGDETIDPGALFCRFFQKNLTVDWSQKL